MAGRVIAVIFGIGATYLTYRLGRRLYDAPIGLLAGTLFCSTLQCSTTPNGCARTVHQYFCCIEFVDDRTLAGECVLAQSAWGWNRYRIGIVDEDSLAPLVGVLLLADGMLVWRAWRNSAEIPYRKVLNCILGLVAIGLAFAFTTPTSSSISQPRGKIWPGKSLRPSGSGRTITRRQFVVVSFTCLMASTTLADYARSRCRHGIFIHAPHDDAAGRLRVYPST